MSWIDVDKNLPTDGFFHLVITQYGDYSVATYNGTHWVTGCGYTHVVKAWHPLHLPIIPKRYLFWR